MAKLTGVKVIDMVGGEITAIEYGGAVYTKVDEQAKEGDIGLRVKQGTSWATVGGYYPIVSNNSYADDVGDEPFFIRGHFVFFRKASESPQTSAPFAEMVMAKVDAVSAKVAAIEAKLAPEELSVGDRVLISGRSMYDADTDGKFGRFERTSNIGGYLVTIEGYGYLFRREQLTKVADTEAPKPKTEQPATGDIVVITANTNNSRNKVGDIGKVEYADEGSAKVHVPNRDKRMNYTRYNEMRLATPAEIAKYEASLVQIAKDDVFAKAGRKPNEYRKGDVVLVLDTSGTVHLNVGQITEVVKPDGTDMPEVRSNDGWSRYAKVEIVCFAEARQDLRADLAKGAC